MVFLMACVLYMRMRGAWKITSRIQKRFGGSSCGEADLLKAVMVLRNFVNVLLPLSCVPIALIYAERRAVVVLDIDVRVSSSLRT